MNNSKESHQKGRSSNAPSTNTASAHLAVYSDNNDSNQHMSSANTAATVSKDNTNELNLQRRKASIVSPRVATAGNGLNNSSLQSNIVPPNVVLTS